MRPVGFEPTRFTTMDLKTISLDRSDIDALRQPIGYTNNIHLFFISFLSFI